MPDGFFKTSDLMTANKAKIPSLPSCGQCGLYKSCKSPKMPYSGKGKKQILILGEAPGENEDEQGIQFIGKSGNLLESTLAKFDIDMRRDCWIHNALACRPGKDNIIKNPKAVDYCRPNVVNVVNKLKPVVVIPLGATALKSLFGWLWREDVGMMSRWDGWQIPNRKLNAWICPTWHPAYLLRTDYGSQRENNVRMMFFEKQLEAAVELAESRPWKEPIVDYTKQVRICKGIDEAVRFLEVFARSPNRPLAIDYETDRLKPDSEDSRIVSCAVSDGKTTISYPWHGSAIKKTGDLLDSRIPKIASNKKFEIRWTLRHFGFPGRNWMWDTMLAAHILDNRPSISSIKFQAFVLLGVDSWDAHIKPFLEGKGTNVPNRIGELGLDKLLLYGGLDALYEWKVAKIQMKRMGLDILGRDD